MRGRLSPQDAGPDEGGRWGRAGVGVGRPAGLGGFGRGVGGGQAAQGLGSPDGSREPRKEQERRGPGGGGAGGRGTRDSPRPRGVGTRTHVLCGLPRAAKAPMGISRAAPGPPPSVLPETPAGLAAAPPRQTLQGLQETLGSGPHLPPLASGSRSRSPSVAGGRRPGRWALGAGGGCRVQRREPGHRQGRRGARGADALPRGGQVEASPGLRGDTARPLFWPPGPPRALTGSCCGASGQKGLFWKLRR